jgi:hypothetical protein
MQLSIKANFPEIQKQLDSLREDIGNKAMVRALNRSIEQGQAEMTRAIGEEFNLTRTKIRQKLEIRKANTGFKGGQLKLFALLMSRDPSGRRRAINLINFAAKETKRGLMVKIKKQGGRVVAARRGFIGNQGRTAFMRTGEPKRRMKSGHDVGKMKEPIRPIQTIDVPQMFNTRRINRRVVEKLKAIFPTVFAREVAFYTRKFGK